MPRQVARAKILTSEIGSGGLSTVNAHRSGAQAGGFTLLELIMALAIAALVVGVSAPAMQRLYQSSQYRGAVNDVVAVLSSARHFAIRSGENSDVRINPDTRKLQHGDKTTLLPGNVELEVLGARELNRDGAGVIRFYPDGGSSGGYVQLTHKNGMSVQIAVDWLLGRVSLCKSDCEITI